MSAEILADTRPVPFVRPGIRKIESSKIAEVARGNLDKPGLIPLWFGESDMVTPEFICRAAADALSRGETFYTHKRGIPELREALSDYMSALYARPVSDERITVTSAGMNGIMLTFQILVDAGDDVVIVSPVWPNAALVVEALGGVPRFVTLDRRGDGGFSFHIEKVRAAIGDRTRAVFVASPGNPTGWVMSRAEQQQLLALSRETGVWIVADEVYARMVYNGRAAPSFLDLVEPDDAVVVVNSFSKSWAMTGWRLGWLVHPPLFDEPLDKLIEYNTSGSPTFVQHAGVAAIRQGEPFVAEMLARCRKGRDVVIPALQNMGRVRVANPDASFYAFFHVADAGDTLAFARHLVDVANVGLAPGNAFGPGAETYLRLCFASGEQTLAEAMERLRPYLS